MTRTIADFGELEVLRKWFTATLDFGPDVLTQATLKSLTLPPAQATAFVATVLVTLAFVGVCFATVDLLDRRRRAATGTGTATTPEIACTARKRTSSASVKALSMLPL